MLKDTTVQVEQLGLFPLQEMPIFLKTGYALLVTTVLKVPHHLCPAHREHLEVLQVETYICIVFVVVS